MQPDVDSVLNQINFSVRHGVLASCIDSTVIGEFMDLECCLVFGEFGFFSTDVFTFFLGNNNLDY